MIEVTEADREAAKIVAFALFDEGFSTGSMAETFTQQAFATHRIEAAKAERDRLREALELADAALSGANMNMNVVKRKIREALQETSQ